MFRTAVLLLLASTALAQAPISRIPSALAGTAAHSYLTGVLDVRNRDIDPTKLKITEATAVLSGPDVAALARALAVDPQATEGAISLTTDLRQIGLIGANEEVIGRDGAQVIIASSDHVRRWQR